MKVTPIVHPAAILKGRPILGPVQQAYIKRLAEHGTEVAIPVESPPPNCYPDPSLAQLESFTYNTRKAGAWIVLDIENAGPYLICCGVLRLTPDLKPDLGVCFRFRHQGGTPWWDSEADHLKVVALLDSLLGDPNITKVTHFGIQHDLPFLLDLGFRVEGPLLDTSVLCHAVHSELPKGLQFLATLFCGAPRWKDVKDEKEGSAEATNEEE